MRKRQLNGSTLISVDGYIQVDVNDEGSYLNFLPASGTFSTHVLQTKIAVDPTNGLDVFTISEG